MPFPVSADQTLAHMRYMNYTHMNFGPYKILELYSPHHVRLITDIFKNYPSDSNLINM